MGAKSWTLVAVVVVLAFAAVLVFRPGAETASATYTIEDREGVLDITIRGWEGPVEPLLGAFRSCQEGNCACPTDEYEHLENMEVQTTDDAIVLRLTPKPDAALDQNEIRACLDFTLGQAGKGAAPPN